MWTNLVAVLLALSLVGGLIWSVFGWRRATDNVERLQTLARWRADQVSMLSHELRTPLTMINLAGDVLDSETSGPLTEPQRRFVETIRRQSASTIELVEDMLTQARIEAGRFSVHIEPCDITEIITGLVTDLRSLGQARIVMDCPAVPCTVFADKMLIRQGLTNLINNAVAVSPPDCPVTIRVTPREHDVLVMVSDKGTGMNAAQRLELFRRFASGRPVGSGTGLGLIITRQIVERHGGQIFVDTVPRRGTTMMFNLPIGEPDEVRE